jgi:hypothetical protein
MPITKIISFAILVYMGFQGTERKRNGDPKRSCSFYQNSRYRSYFFKKIRSAVRIQRCGWPKIMVECPTASQKKWVGLLSIPHGRVSQLVQKLNESVRKQGRVKHTCGFNLFGFYIWFRYSIGVTPVTR